MIFVNLVKEEMWQTPRQDNVVRKGGDSELQEVKEHIWVCWPQDYGDLVLIQSVWDDDHCEYYANEHQDHY